MTNVLTEEIWETLEHGLTAIVIKLTQMCNMKCVYCPHAQEDNDLMKHHENRTICEAVALNGIDIFLKHSDKTSNLDVVFFGGEPLIAFPLIKKIVTYTEARTRGKLVTFNITTNALMMTEEMMIFFSSHRFSVCISLDGPREIHDLNRKNKRGEGTFDRVIRNYRKLKQKFETTHSKVLINAVFDKKCNIPIVEAFFSGEDFKGVTIFPNLVDDSASRKKIVASEDFSWRMDYTKFLILLYLYKRILPQDLPLSAEMFRERMSALQRKLDISLKKEMSIETRIREMFAGKTVLFLNNEGDIYLGTSVNEKNEALVIGNTIEGIKKKNLSNMVNKCCTYLSVCISCPYFNVCDLSLATYLEKQGNQGELKKSQCKSFMEMYNSIYSLHLLKSFFEMPEFRFLKKNNNKTKDIAWKSELGLKERTVSSVQLCFNDSLDSIENVINDVLFFINCIQGRKIHCEKEDILLLSPVALNPSQLVQLVYVVEHHYSISFSSNDFRDNGFATLYGIAKKIIEKSGLRI